MAAIMIKFPCKNCGQRLNVDDKHAGRQFKCLKCQNIVLVPGREPLPVQAEAQNVSSTPLPLTAKADDNAKRTTDFVTDAVVHSFSTNISLIALVAANLVPLVGVLFFKWSVWFILLLYSMENLVILFYNVPKHALVPKKLVPKGNNKLIVIFTLVFIPGPLAVFIFLGALRGFYLKTNDIGIKVENIVFGLGLPGVSKLIQSLPYSIILTFFAFFISQSIEFVYNYLTKGQYNPDTLGLHFMLRLVGMCLAFMAFGFLLDMGFSETPGAVLVIIVVLKTIVDAILHLNEHKRIRIWD
jgi:DNA-directed RNA polymerase subunit RPC12/RpoP